VSGGIGTRFMALDGAGDILNGDGLNFPRQSVRESASRRTESFKTDPARIWW